MYGTDIALGDNRSAGQALTVEDLKDREQLQEYIRQQKVIIKKAQEKLTMCRQQYKQDKQRFESDESLKEPANQEEYLR